VLTAVAGLVILGALTFRSVPSEFTPAADVGRVFVAIEGPEGSSFQYMDGYARRLEAIALEEMEKGDIQRVLVRVPGQGGGDPRTGDVNSARVFLILKPWRDRERSADEILAAVLAEAEKLPGVRASSGQPASLGRRNVGRPIQAVIGGPDYEQLAAWAQELRQLAESNPGLVNVDTNYRERKPQIRISEDRDRAADLGISLATIGRTLETVLGSRVVTTYVDRGREYDVILQARNDLRQTSTDLTNIRVRSTRTDELIPLSSVIRLEETSGTMQLSRFNRLRSIKITADLAPGYTMGEAVEWFTDTVARELPPEATLMSAAVLHFLAGPRRRLSRAGGSVRELRASPDHHGHRPARVARRGVRAQVFRSDDQHLQSNRGHHADRNRREERRAHRRIREPAA
jgi:multidrug efflux pump